MIHDIKMKKQLDVVAHEHALSSLERAVDIQEDDYDHEIRSTSFD